MNPSKNHEVWATRNVTPPPVRREQVKSEVSHVLQYRLLRGGKSLYLTSVCLLLCWLLPAPTQAQQDYLDDWKWRNPLPQGNLLSAVAHGNSTFVAVGVLGMIVSSPNSVDWTIRRSGLTSTLNGVAFGNGIFVAVGDDGKVLTSAGGAIWTSRNSGTTQTLRAVAYGNGRFVVVGSGGTIRTSTDGISWTSRTSGTTSTLRGCTFANGTFVAVGNSGTILTSTDGENWVIRTSGTNNWLYGINFGNGSFVAVGLSGTILTSDDGVSWITRTSGTNSPLSAVVHGNGSFVIAGQSSMILTSADGVNWTSQSSGTTQFLSGVSYGNGTFVAVGERGVILTSVNGVNWTIKSSGMTQYLGGVAYGNGNYVAVGFSGTILTSFDGLTWTNRTSGTTAQLQGITFGNDTFVTVGSQGIILTSPDGVEWTSRSSGTAGVLHSITYGNEGFAAVGDNGTILTSPDGENWTSRTSGTSSLLYGITFGKGTFVAVGGAGTILTSATGEDWINRSSGTASWLQSATYGNGNFVAVGAQGTILTSPDAVSWTSRNSGTNSLIYEITYGNGSFVTVGLAGMILSSANAVNWTTRNSGTSNELGGVKYANDTFVAVGNFGTILQSSPEVFGLQVGRSSTFDLEDVGIIAMRNVPRGLSFDVATSTLSGTPLRPGTFKVRITKLNAEGKRVNSLLTFVIKPLPTHAFGNFQAVTDGEVIPGIPPGGSLSFKISSTGLATGQLRLAGATYRWRGSVVVSGDDDANIALQINRRRQTPLQLELEIANDHTLQGRVVNGAAETLLVGWRQVWHRRLNPPPPAQVGRINTLLVLNGAPWVGDPTVPQGHGYAMLSSNISGSVRWLGQLADGTRLTGSTALGPDGQVALWSSLLRNTGSVLIGANLDEAATLQGAAVWTRLPQTNPRLRNFRDGFDAVRLNLSGGRWTPPVRNQTVLELPLTDPNAELILESGGLDQSATDLAQTLLTIDSRNRVTPATNEANLSVRIVPKTGLVRVRFQLNDGNPENPGRNLRRTVNATSLLLPGLPDGYIGGGFFLLPQLAIPPDSTSRTSPILSGRILLRQPNG